MKIIVHNGNPEGEVHAPPSKSAMQRACALALLAKGKSVIRNAGTSNDDKAALGVIRNLGAEVNFVRGNTVEITSNGIKNAGEEIYCGESGLGIRMFAPIAALSNKEIRITGSGSLRSRPMDFFDKIFPELSVKVQTNNGKLPITIKGPLQPKNITIDGSLSSQFLTGLLMAYAASGNAKCSIKVNELKSKPYIDLTLEMLKMAGVDVENENYQYFRFKGNSGEIQPFQYAVEGDWSGAAFFLVAGAVKGNVTVRGLKVCSFQADKAILQSLKAAGAVMVVKEDFISVSASALHAFETDATDCPDLFPPLAALAAYSKGISKIKGVSRLAHKESHRGLTIQQELGKLGVEVKLEGDEMIIKGEKSFHSSIVTSHNDHRIAMMAAVLALGCKESLTIENAEAVNKSYPAFFEHLTRLGIRTDINQK